MQVKINGEVYAAKMIHEALLLRQMSMVECESIASKIPEGVSTNVTHETC